MNIISQAAVVCLMAIGLIPTAPIHAQTLTEEEIKAQFVRDWKRAKAYTLEYLEAMPADKYSFRPTDSTRSFAQQMLHLAEGNVFLLSNGTGRTPPPPGNWSTLEHSPGAATKDSVKYYVIESYDYAIDAVVHTGIDRWGEIRKVKAIFGSDQTTLAMMLKAFEHQTHQRGQTTIYIRLLGIKPPRERLFLDADDDPPGQPKAVSFIKVGKMNIYAASEGGGEPLIFLHGGYMDHRMWEPQVRFFRSIYRVITVDLPGHGLTAGVDTSLLIEEVIRTVLDSLKIDKTNLVGLSLGTMCALDFTMAYPERVKRLILTSPGLDILSSVIRIDPLSKKMFARSDSIGATNNAPAMARDFMESWCVGPYRMDSQVNPAVRNYVYQTTLGNMMKQPHVWPRFNQNHSPADVDRIKCPLMVIHGDQDIPYIAAVADYLRVHHPGVRAYTMKGVAHMLNMEHPAEFNHMVQQFLK